MSLPDANRPAQPATAASRRIPRSQRRKRPATARKPIGPPIAKPLFYRGLEGTRVFSSRRGSAILFPIGHDDFSIAAVREKCGTRLNNDPPSPSLSTLSRNDQYQNAAKFAPAIKGGVRNGLIDVDDEGRLHSVDGSYEHPFPDLD
jgi:hypothetical protein